MSVVLVTGSSSGIGLATALHFARLGHDVYAGVRNPATAGELTAGIGGGGPLADVPVDFAKALFETNYFGAIRMIQAVVPGMRAQRGGAIVNISSVWGRVAVAGHGHYCAAKHALEAASEALAQEVYAFGIRVAIVEPGVVLTPIFSKARRFADPASPFAVQEEFLAVNRQRYGFGR